MDVHADLLLCCSQAKNRVSLISHINDCCYLSIDGLDGF